MEKGHWQVNGINLNITDFLQQDGVEDGHIKRIFILDAWVGTEEADAFMDVMDAHLGFGGYLTFTRGTIQMDATFSEFVYHLDADGCAMRLVIQPKGYDAAPEPGYLQQKAGRQLEMTNRLLSFLESENLMDSETLESVRKESAGKQKPIDVFIEVTDIHRYLKENGLELNQLRDQFH